MRTLEGEYWVDLEGSNNVKLSNFGRFRRGNKLLKKQFDKDGYIMHSVGGELKRIYAHRYVAKYFVKNDNPEVNIVVDHIDGNKENCRADNLRWTTVAINTKSAYDLGLIKANKKGFVLAKKLEDDTYQLFRSIVNCARNFDVSPKALDKVIRGTQKSVHNIFACRILEDIDDEYYSLKIAKRKGYKKEDYRKLIKELLNLI